MRDAQKKQVSKTCSGGDTLVHSAHNTNTHNLKYACMYAYEQPFGQVTKMLHCCIEMWGVGGLGGESTISDLNVTKINSAKMA